MLLLLLPLGRRSSATRRNERDAAVRIQIPSSHKKLSRMSRLTRTAAAAVPEEADRTDREEDQEELCFVKVGRK